jgi:hypothetical protein
MMIPRRFLIRRASMILLLSLGVAMCSAAFGQRVRRPPTRLPVPSLKPPPMPEVMRIRVKDGLVTAQVIATPLPEVLAELAARSGVVFQLQSQDRELVSISLDRVSLEEAIRRILVNSNTVFYYVRDEAGQSHVGYVRAFPRGNIPQQPSLMYIGTGGVTKTGDDTVDTPAQALQVLAEGGSLEARLSAVEILSTAKEEAGATEALSKVLQDSAPALKIAAIEGLAGLGDRSSLPQILKALRDGDPGVRQSAITAVALLGDSKNIKSLQALTKDKDLNVVAAAEMAIQMLSAQER